MITSFTNKFETDINYLKNQSDKFISSERFYLVNLQFPNEEGLQTVTEDFLYSHTNQPGVVYHHSDTIWLVFSCLTEGSHYLNGSHQEIVSEYFNLIFSKYGFIPRKINIVEFETQIQLISYFLWEIFHNSKKTILKYSGGKITPEDLVYNTYSEVISMLNDHTDWEGIPREERYGVFYKLKLTKEGITTLSFSESFDSRNLKKYINFLMN